MEQHSQSGKPVNLNALLIGEKTIPKGCRVIHVSSHGMLLQCEPDGRPRAFSDGDSVDIHLTVQHNGEQKKLTIPSHVRHVSDNSLDVEFHHPDPVLLDLIESYRTSEEHMLEACIGDTLADDEHPDVIPMPGVQAHEHPDTYALSDDQPGQSGRRSGTVSGLIILLCMAGLLAAVYLYTSGLHTRVDALERIAGIRDSELADVQDKLFSASLLEGKYASLDARISSLGNAFANLEQRVQLILAGKTSEAGKPQAVSAQAVARHSAPASDPAAFSGTVIRSVGEGGAPAETVREPAQVSASTASATPSPATKPTSARNTATAGHQAIAERQPVSATAGLQGSGPWAINLISSIDRQDPERIARRAESADIPTLLTSADIKGRQYWRLQVTGFKSLAMAKASAPAIQQALGIREVWYLKRKPGSSAHNAGQ
jgi:hypothetical protein